MKGLDAVKAAKERTMAAAVANLENLNAVEDLMEAHRGKISKQDAMTKHTGIFQEQFAANDAAEEQRRALCQEIAQHGPALQQLTGSNVADPATTQFFMQLSQAQMEVEMLAQMTEQGFNFYNQLNDWLNRSKQNIYDFKMVRDMEKTEAVKALAAAPTPPPVQQQQ